MSAGSKASRPHNNTPEKLAMREKLAEAVKRQEAITGNPKRDSVLQGLLSTMNTDKKEKLGS